MKRFSTPCDFLILLFLIVLFSMTINAQERKESPRKRFVELPASEVLITVAIQPGCPLQILNPHAYYDLDSGRMEFYFGVRNAGTKRITGFQTAACWETGTGGTLGTSWGKKGNKRVLAPGKQIDLVDKDSFQLVSLTPDLREKLELNGKPRKMIVFTVEYVMFADGSQLDDFSFSGNVSSFLSNLSEGAYR